MYLENLNGQYEDNDLKFIPLNIREPFKNKDSSWYPAIDTSLPTLSNISNNFIMGLSVPVDNSNLEVRSFRTLDYLPKNEMNIGNPIKQVMDGQFSNNKMLEQQMNSINSNNNMNTNTNDGMNNVNLNNMNWNNINPNSINKNSVNTNNINNSQYSQPMSLQEKQLSNDADFDIEYPSETIGEELYSYNKNEGCKGKVSKRQEVLTSNSISAVNNLDNVIANNKIKDTSLELEYEDFETSLVHMELLRELSEETSHSNIFRGESYNLLDEIDDIFKILKKDEDIINIFKAYRVPEPIYNLVINKIIKRTLENTTYKRGE